MIVNATDIVAYVFEYGAFNKNDTEIVAECMVCYSIGVLSMALEAYFIRVFYALQDIKITVKITVFALLCNIILNLISINFLQHKGIALATSISLVIAYVILAYILKNKHDIKNIDAITKDGCIAIVISAVSTGLLHWLFTEFCITPYPIVNLAFEGITFIVMYFIMIGVFRKEMMHNILGVLKR